MAELRIENMSLKQDNFSKEPSMMKSWLMSVFLDFFCSHEPSTCSSNLSYLSNWIPNMFSLLLSTIALSQSKLSFLQFLWAIKWHWSRPPDFMRKKCPCSGVFWHLYSRIWNEYGDLRIKSAYSVRMLENTDQKNSKYGYFLGKVIFCKNHLKREMHQPRKLR